MQIHGKSIDSLVVKILQWHGGVICACHCMVGDRGLWLPEVGLCINTSTMADGAAESSSEYVGTAATASNTRLRHPPAAIAHEKPSRIAKTSSAPLTLPPVPSPAHLLLAILSRALVLLVAATPATATRRLVPARVLPLVRHRPNARLPHIVRVPGGQQRRAAVCEGILPGAAEGAVERAGARLRVGGVGRAPRKCGDGRAGEGGAGGGGGTGEANDVSNAAREKVNDVSNTPLSSMARAYWKRAPVATQDSPDALTAISFVGLVMGCIIAEYKCTQQSTRFAFISASGSSPLVERH